MSARKLLSMALLTTVPWSQSAPSQKAVEEAHYPPLIRAELPLYPPLALTAHISGTVEIQVAVENGSVVDAQVQSVEIQITDPLNRAAYNEEAKSKASPILSNPSLTNVKSWQFQLKDRTSFVVRYVYKIDGKQTSVPENPKVELGLPLLVKITARPLKPACSDCSPSIPAN
jgi:hypothetical protein